MILFPFVICGKNIGHSYLRASKNNFFIMNPNPTESSQLTGYPLLQLTKLVVNAIGHLHVPLKNVKSCAQCERDIPSVLFHHTYKVFSPMITHFFPAPMSVLFPLANFRRFKERCVMNNYFGIGLDAKISLEFNTRRDEHPRQYK